MNDDLKSIVELAISNGYGLNDISSGLAEDGWGQADIDAAVNYYNSKKKSQGKGGASPSTSQPKPTSSEYQQTSTAAPTQLAQTIEWGPTEFRQGLGAGVQGAQEPKRDTEEEKQAARKRTALQERQAIGLDIASILTSDNPDSDDNKQKISSLYEQYKQADANYAGQEMLYQNIFNDEGSVDQNVYNYVVNDAVASINETAARELEQYKRTGGESVLDRSINTLFAGVESIAGGVAMGVELLKDANNYRLGIPNYGEMSPVGELGSEMLQGSQKTMYSVFRAAGYSDEQIKKGTLGMATEEGDLGMLYYTALQQVPQLALMAATGGTAGMTTLGLSSAGAAYDELYQDPSYNVSEKLIYGLASGVVEGVSERIFQADVRALRGIFGTADDVAKLSTREFAKKYMPKLSAINDAIPGLAKSTAQEAFEEGLVAVTQESIKYALNEDKQNFDVHDIAESMFVGAVMGGSIHSIAYGPSALLNSRLFVDKYTLRNKIVETQKLLNDPTLSEEERDILSGQLNDFVRKEREMKDSAAEYYSNWEDSDINETQRLNQVINRGLKAYSKMRSNVAKDKILADVKDAFNAKQEIEKKYDSQTEGQVSGAVQGGETAQQGQPVQGPSAKTTPAGGVLQVSEQAQQESAKIKVKAVKVTNENASKSVDWLKDWVNNLAETGFQFIQTNKQTVLDGLDSIQKVAQFMHNNGRDVNIVTHTDADSYKKATGLENVTRGYYIAEEGNSSQIHVFVPAMLSNTAYHEGIHEVLPSILGTEGTRRLGRRLWNVIRGDKALLRQMQSFMRNYSEMTETEMADEFLTELGSLIADGSIELEVSKSIATKFMESIAEIMGTAFGVNMKPSTAQLAQALIDLGGAISTGEKLDYTTLPQGGKMEDVVFTGLFPKAQEISEDTTYGNSYTDEYGYTYSYLADNEEFKNLVDNGTITFGHKQSDFHDVPLVIHQPDNAFTGNISKDGSVIVEGKGGVFYPIKYNDMGVFWASTKNMAVSTAKKLNKIGEVSDGKIRMMLVTGLNEKVLSSTTGLNGILDILSSKVASESFRFNDANFLSALISANQVASKIDSKKKPMKVFPEGVTLDDAIKLSKEYAGPENSTFNSRRLFSEELMRGLAQSVEDADTVSEFREFLGIKTRGGKISMSNLVEGFSRILNEPILKGLPQGLSYAVVEIDGPVEAVEFKAEDGGHESYPYTIRSVKGNKAKVKLFQNPTNWFESVYDTSKGRRFRDDMTPAQVKKSSETVLPPTSGMSEIVYLNPSEQTLKTLESENIVSAAQKEKYSGKDSEKKYGKAQEIGPAPESSNLNTYQVSVYLQSNMERSFADFSKNALENLKSGKGVSLHDAETKAGEKGYISTIKVAAESRYRDSSRYFSAYFSSLNTGKKVRVKIRVSDHEIPKNETARLDEYGSGGVYRTSDRRDKESKFSYNIWNRQTFNSAFDHLKTLGFTFPTEIKSEYFTFNRRSQQAINIQNELAELLFVNTTRDKDGNIVIDLSREDFITTANIYGLPEHIAHEMYDKQLEGKLSVEIKGTDAIDATYENYLDATANLIAKATTLYEKLKKYFIDRQSTVKAYLVSAGLDNVRKLLVNRSGASAYAKYLFDKWDILVYKGLDVEAQRMLDKIVFLRRVIQIDEATDGRKRVILNEKAMLQGELVAKQHELYLAPQNEYAKILKEIKELEANIAKLQSEADAIVRVQHPKFYGNSSWNKESAYAQLDQIKQKLGQETYDDMFKRSDEYFNAFRELLNSMNKEGLITQEDYDALSSFDYQPRMFVKHVFDNVEDDVALRDYGLSQSQIKALRNGSQSEILMDSRLILSIYSKSVTARIAKNKANRELAKGLKNPRNSDWLLPNPNGEAAQSGFENVYYYDKGEQRVFQMRKDLKQEWDDVSQIFKMSPTMQKLIGYASGSFALKLLATRANPLFVLRNLPRDYFHVLFFTDTYENTPLPVAAFKLIGDFYRGVKSKVTDDADFQDYVRLGGMMDFLSTEGKPSAYKKSTWGRLADRTLHYTSAPGEYSEIGFRIAVYKKMVQNGLAQFEKANKRKPDADELEMIKSGAVTAAREVIDFSQGGSFTKGAEIVTPYLNSAFQGMRVSWDYIKANPKQFASRLAQMQFGIIALALYNASIGDDEMEDIPDETKKRYFIIMTLFMTEDSKGRKVRRYIKVAKTQQMMPFFAMAEIASDQIISDMFGKKPQFSSDQLKYAVDGIASFFPKDLTKIDKEILSAMPLLSAVTTYTTNYDAFREQVIEKNLGEMLPQTEGLFDKDIPYFYKVIGDLTEMSPKRLQVAAEKMITSPYSSALVGGAYALMDVFASPYVIEGKYDKEGGLSMSENFSVKMKTMLPKSFSMGQTNPDWKSYNIAEDIEKINQEEGSNRKQVRELSKRFAKSYRDAETEKERKQVLEDASVKMKEIAKENPLDAKYFKSSFKTAAMVSGHYSPFTNEIVYAVSDMARAKIIRRVLVERGGVGREDFIELRKELFKESRYEINSSTMAMYKKLYGNFD